MWKWFSKAAAIIVIRLRSFWLGATLALGAGCLTPGAGEMDSGSRAEQAGQAVGGLLRIADSSARTLERSCRFSLAPAKREMWLAQPDASGAFEPLEDWRQQLDEHITVDRVEGMTRQSDGSYTLLFRPSGGVSRDLKIYLSDAGGARRAVGWRAGEQKPQLFEVEPSP